MGHNDPEEGKPGKGGFAAAKKKYYLAAGIVLAAVVFAAALYYFNYYRQPDQTVPTAGGEAVQQPAEAILLPQPVREGQEGLPGRQVPDPFAGPPKLVGVLLGGGGEDLAIIEYRGATFVVVSGDELEGTWIVESVNNNNVSLKGEGRMLNLKLDGETDAPLNGEASDER